jgi:hypothetical protein
MSFLNMANFAFKNTQGVSESKKGSGYLAIIKKKTHKSLP